jgi:F-box and WD-40 domain protein CDC4
MQEEHLKVVLLIRKILTFLDDPRTFVRASRVSRRWREVLSDDQAWKLLCDKHAYRRMSSDAGSPNSPYAASNLSFLDQLPHAETSSDGAVVDKDSNFLRAAEHVRNLKRPRPRSTHRSHFKHRYLVESAWRKGGQMTAKHITPDQGVVTSLHLTKKYIVVALDNAKIHVFNIKGDHQRTLQGHGMGVWAMIPWGDTLVSGGCDRDVRVWNMATG